jgi:predicted ATPase with chaperone activity
MPDKKLGEMTPDERHAAVRRAAARFQDELDRTGPAIGKILEDPDATSGPPTTLTGLRRETRDRIRTAIINSGEAWPTQAIAVTLPARLAERSSADLAIAVSVLAAEGAVPAAALAGAVFLAELGLDGSLRPVPSVQPAVNAAAEGGMDTVVVAAGDAADAAQVPGMCVIAAGSLMEVTAWLRSQTCGTIGCRSAATHTLTYSFPESRDVTETDTVCQSCGEGYLRRPTLKASLGELGFQ